MVLLNDLNKYLSRILNFNTAIDLNKVDSLMSNGLVVKGSNEINKVGFAVSASLKLFETAEELNYNTLIVHHSINFPINNRYDQIFQNRISFLIKNQISLFGYHFLLDAHPKFGNAVSLLKLFKAKICGEYLINNYPWGYIGELEKPLSFDDFDLMVSPILSSRKKIYNFGPKYIKRIAVVTGKGAPHSNDMQYLNDNEIDLFLTGEVHEWNRELFREAGISLIAGGHYNTETYGLKNLMNEISQGFPKLEIGWIELSNDV